MVQSIVREFLTFAQSKDIELGGYSTYGYALQYTEFRPLHKDDYETLIKDFVVSIGGTEDGTK